MGEPTLENVEGIRSSLESYEPGTEFSMDREESLIQPEQGFHPMVEIPDGTYTQQPEVKVTHEEFTTGSEPGEAIRTVKTTTTRTIIGEPTLENVEDIRSSLESYEPETEFSMGREESLIQPEQGFHPMVQIPDGTYTQQPEVKVTHEEFTTGSEPGETIRTVKTTTTRTIIGEPTLENVEDIRSSLESYEPGTDFSMDREESLIHPEQGSYPVVETPDGTYTQQPEVKVTQEEFTTGSEPGETIRTVKTTTTRTIIGEPTLENVEGIRSSLESYEPGTEFSMDREESLIQPEQVSHPVVPGIQMEFEPLTVAEPVIGQDELLITSDRSDAEEEASSIREDGTQLFKLVTETSPAELEEAVPQDGFTQPSAEASQMVQGPPAPSDVKPTAPVVPAGHVITEQRPIEKATGLGTSGIQNNEDKKEQRQTPQGALDHIVPAASGLSTTEFNLQSDGFVYLTSNNSSGINGTNLVNNNSYFSEAISTNQTLVVESSGTQVDKRSTLVEMLAQSAHRPTTLKITSPSVVDENEHKTNDPDQLTGKNEFLNNDSFKTVANKCETSTDIEASETCSEQVEKLNMEDTSTPEQVSSGVIPRPERSNRPSVRSAAVLKVKVEKRPISNHPNRERSFSTNFKETVQSVPPSNSLSPSKLQNKSVEDEVIGLMAEVKEATKQIKKEVRQLRESETPTPDTPTPLREFREFLSDEEEQELQRLPTITETGKETEEEGTSNVISGEMECILTSKNHISTDRRPSTETGKHVPSEKDVGHTAVSQNNKNCPVKLDNIKIGKWAALRNNVNKITFNPLKLRSPNVVENIVNVEAPLRISSAQLKKNDFKSDLDISGWDNSSVVSNSTETLPNYNRTCSYCTKDFLLNDVCNELGNVIAIVEEGIKCSKNVNVDKIITSLDTLKFKVGNIFNSPNSVNQKSIEIPQNYNQQNYVTQNLNQIYNEDNIQTFEYFDSSEIYDYSKMSLINGGATDKQSFVDVQEDDNEVNEEEFLTDCEDLEAKDVSPDPVLPKLKLKGAEDSDEENLTDEDCVEGSEDDDDEDEKGSDPIDIQPFLPDHHQELLSLTEGYARTASPLYSDNEENCKGDLQDIENRHDRNVRETIQKALSVDNEEACQASTDEENMIDSADDILAEEEDEVETTLPNHYLEEIESFLNHEIVKSIVPVSKFIFSCKKKARLSRQKLMLRVQQEGIYDKTDTEDLSSEQVEKNINERPKRKKPKRKKGKGVPEVSVTLSSSGNEESGNTDTELLHRDTGSSSNDESSDDFSENYINVLKDLGDVTDTEYMQTSDIDADDLISKPIKKDKDSVIPEPFFEKVRISEKADIGDNNAPEENTDEEGFQLEDIEDKAPLMMPVTRWNDSVSEGNSNPESGGEEDKLTDLDEIDIDEKEDEDIINDIIQKMPKDDSEILLEMESHSHSVSNVETKSENIVKGSNKFALSSGINSDEAITDVEEWDDKGNVSTFKKKSKSRPAKAAYDTDSDSIEGSEEESLPKRNKAKTGKKSRKKLPLVPQISEVRFLETEYGHMSIIITPDSMASNPDNQITDNLKDVVFLESYESDDAVTEVEELDDLEDKEYENNLAAIDKDTKNTDTEVEDFEETELTSVNEPEVTLASDISYLPSPTRQKIHIVEDKHGVPNVKIEKLDDLLTDELEHEQAVTDTDNIDISDDEASYPSSSVNLDDKPAHILTDAETTEISTKTKSKKNRKVNLFAVNAEEDGHTDVEIIIPSRKVKRKTKAKKTQIEIDSDQSGTTDTEVLYDTNPNEQLLIPNTEFTANTDCEHFEDSGDEDSEETIRERVDTPELIRKSGIKRTIYYKEQPSGTFQTEIQEQNQTSNFITLGAEPSGTTDVEDIEISDAEEVNEETFSKTSSDGVLPHNEESNVSVSLKVSIPYSKEKEEAEIKDNLFLPTDNHDNHTEVESMDEGEEIGDFESSAADGPKVEARTKSPLREADLSVLDSLMTTQDAQIEEMTFTHTMDDTQAQKDNVTRSQPSFSSQFQSETDSTNAKPKLPPKNKAGTKRRAPPPPPRKDPIEATDKKDPDVSPKKARGAPEWGGQTSSDEGEEQLTLMRDSPRWEDEEIQAEDHDEPRPIKAEIKLLVKTTELGKESIEIRSIREFMDPKDKTVADADASEGQAKGETLQHISLSTTSEDTHAHHHPSPQGGKASPRFVRPKETFSSHEKETDDFDLMAQVRDVIAETETEKAFITHCDSDQESSKKSPKKKKKGPK